MFSRCLSLSPCRPQRLAAVMRHQPMARVCAVLVSTGLEPRVWLAPRVLWPTPQRRRASSALPAPRSCWVAVSSVIRASSRQQGTSRASPATRGTTVMARTRARLARVRGLLYDGGERGGAVVRSSPPWSPPVWSMSRVRLLPSPACRPRGLCAPPFSVSSLPPPLHLFLHSPPTRRRQHVPHPSLLFFSSRTTFPRVLGLGLPADQC